MSKFIRYLILILFILFTRNAFARKTCCWRNIDTLPIPMPSGQKYNLSGFIATGFKSVFLKDLSGRDDCPQIDFLFTEESPYDYVLEYVFKGTITAHNPIIIEMRQKCNRLFYNLTIQPTAFNLVG